ncbi:hypothetical protein PMAYCL1PPCAC_07330, partial [Pristionchus mayeri]
HHNLHVLSPSFDRFEFPSADQMERQMLSIRRAKISTYTKIRIINCLNSSDDDRETDLRISQHPWRYSHVLNHQFYLGGCTSPRSYVSSCRGCNYSIPPFACDSNHGRVGRRTCLKTR